MTFFSTKETEGISKHIRNIKTYSDDAPNIYRENTNVKPHISAIGKYHG